MCNEKRVSVSTSMSNCPGVTIARVRGALSPACGTHKYRVCSALSPAKVYRMAHGFQRFLGFCRRAVALHGNHVRQPLMMQPRRVHGVLHGHLEVDEIEHDFHHSVDDRASAGTADHRHACLRADELSLTTNVGKPEPALTS